MIKRLERSIIIFKQAEYWKKILNTGDRDELCFYLTKVGLDEESIEVFLKEYDLMEKQILEEEKEDKRMITITLNIINNN